MKKARLSISVDQGLIDPLRAAGVNVSGLCNEVLLAAVEAIGEGSGEQTLRLSMVTHTAVRIEARREREGGL